MIADTRPEDAAMIEMMEKALATERDREKRSEAEIRRQIQKSIRDAEASAQRGHKN